MGREVVAQSTGDSDREALLRSADHAMYAIKLAVPLMREYGHEVTGLYEVLSNQHEVVMVWATDIPSQVRLRQNRDAARGLDDDGDADDRLVAWERTAAEFVTGGDTHIMTPLPPGGSTAEGVRCTSLS